MSPQTLLFVRTEQFEPRHVTRQLQAEAAGDRCEDKSGAVRPVQFQAQFAPEDANPGFARPALEAQADMSVVIRRDRISSILLRPTPMRPQRP
jgi:hypothetical protein